MEERLVNVAQPEPERSKGVKHFFRYPAHMTDFNDQRVFLKAFLKDPEVLSMIRFILKRPWELDENRAEPVCFGDRPNSCFEVSLFRRPRPPLMRERVEQLRGETKVAIMADAVDPSTRRRGLRWAVI